MSTVYINSGVTGQDKDIIVKTSKSGPAFTLAIKSKSGLEINVDLVPVFQLHGTVLVPKVNDQKKHL